RPAAPRATRPEGRGPEGEGMQQLQQRKQQGGGINRHGAPANARAGGAEQDERRRRDRQPARERKQRNLRHDAERPECSDRPAVKARRRPIERREAIIAGVARLDEARRPRRSKPTPTAQQGSGSRPTPSTPTPADRPR